jgi:hypothetical protein
VSFETAPPVVRVGVLTAKKEGDFVSVFVEVLSTSPVTTTSAATVSVTGRFLTITVAGIGVTVGLLVAVAVGLSVGLVVAVAVGLSVGVLVAVTVGSSVGIFDIDVAVGGTGVAVETCATGLASPGSDTGMIPTAERQRQE